MLSYRSAITVAMTDSHGTEFVENKYRIRAEQRATVLIERSNSMAECLVDDGVITRGK
jgi:hypothetical protein